MVTVDRSTRMVPTARMIAARDLRTAQICLSRETNTIARIKAATPDTFAEYALMDARARRDYWLAEMGKRSRTLLFVIEHA